MTDLKKSRGPTQSGPKTQIAYHLGQAILALGKDDLPRVRHNLNSAHVLFEDYEQEREAKRDHQEVQNEKSAIRQPKLAR